jgi:hypothetical protein
MDEQHLSHLAYRCGYCLTRFRARVVSSWWHADGESPMPYFYDQWAAEIATYAEDLVPSCPCRKCRAAQQRADRARQLLDQVLRHLRERWNSQDHHDDIEAWREALECEAGVPWEAAALHHDAWKDLLPGVFDFWVALPPRVGRWAALGACVYHPQHGEEEETRIPRLRTQLSRMRADSLLQGLDVHLTEAAYEEWLASGQTYSDSRSNEYDMWLGDQVSELHRELLRRLADGMQDAGSSESADGAEGRTGVAAELVDKETFAIAVHHKHPYWSMSQIAAAVGVSRTTPYRWANYLNFRVALREILPPTPRARRSDRSRNRVRMPRLGRIDEQDPADLREEEEGES